MKINGGKFWILKVCNVQHNQSLIKVPKVFNHVWAIDIFINYDNVLNFLFYSPGRDSIMDCNLYPPQNFVIFGSFYQILIGWYKITVFKLFHQLFSSTEEVILFIIIIFGVYQLIIHCFVP